MNKKYTKRALYFLNISSFLYILDDASFKLKKVYGISN